LRRRWLPIPRQQLGEPVDRMAADVRDHGGEPGLGLDAVEACGLDERVERSRTLTTSIATCEEVIFSAEGYWPDLVLRRIV
jgi:hypothetical protein